jgi:signal transduction histidine kinase
MPAEDARLDELLGAGAGVFRIGLAVGRRTIEAHGGMIVAEPVAGRGTAMRCSLPTDVLSDDLPQGGATVLERE